MSLWHGIACHGRWAAMACGQKPLAKSTTRICARLMDGLSWQESTRRTSTLGRKGRCYLPCRPLRACINVPLPPALPGTKEFGNTEVQTEGVFKNIERVLAKSGLKLGDVVKMQVFLVGDAAHGGKMDFAGFMTGYKKFFGTTEQPNLPARSVMQVAGLVNPGWLVEIEVTAVKAAK